MSAKIRRVTRFRANHDQPHMGQALRHVLLLLKGIVELDC